MAMTEPAPCGTYGAYQRHRLRGEEPCESCRAANAAYHREFRASNPDYYAREKLSNAARDRAYARLAREYPERWAVLFAEESASVYEPDGAA